MKKTVLLVLCLAVVAAAGWMLHSCGSSGSGGTTESEFTLKGGLQ